MYVYMCVNKCICVKEGVQLPEDGNMNVSSLKQTNVYWLCAYFCIQTQYDKQNYTHIYIHIYIYICVLQCLLQCVLQCVVQCASGCICVCCRQDAGDAILGGFG